MYLPSAGWRPTAALLVLLAGALYATAPRFAYVRRAHGAVVDPVSAFEYSVGGLRELLPPRGMVTYLPSRPVQNIRLAGQETVQYYLVQYVVAPVVLDARGAHAYAITRPLSGDDDRLRGWEPIAGTRNGFVLYKRAAP
jgi:hypothetical protein